MSLLLLRLRLDLALPIPRTPSYYKQHLSSKAVIHKLWKTSGKSVHGLQRKIWLIRPKEPQSLKCQQRVDISGCKFLRLLKCVILTKETTERQWPHGAGNVQPQHFSVHLVFFSGSFQGEQVRDSVLALSSWQGPNPETLHRTAVGSMKLNTTLLGAPLTKTLVRFRRKSKLGRNVGNK